MSLLQYSITGCSVMPPPPPPTKLSVKSYAFQERMIIPTTIDGILRKYLKNCSRGSSATMYCFCLFYSCYIFMIEEETHHIVYEPPGNVR